MWIYPSSFLPPPFKYSRSACFPVLSNPHEDADRPVCSSLATQLQELLVWKGLIGFRQKFSVPRGFSIIFMTHHSYTCDAVLLQKVSLLRFVVLQRALTAQMKGIGLSLILLGNLLCIIFLFFFFFYGSRMHFWHIVHKQTLFWVEAYLVVEAMNCGSVSDWVSLWIPAWALSIDLLCGHRQPAHIFLSPLFSLLLLLCGDNYTTQAFSPVPY